MLPDRVSNPGPLTYESGVLKVKVTLTLREVILPHDNCYLIIVFRSGFVFNRLSTSTTGSLT